MADSFLDIRQARDAVELVRIYRERGPYEFCEALKRKRDQHKRLMDMRPTPTQKEAGDE